MPLLLQSGLYSIIQGSVLSHTSPLPSAIVNAANERCLGGGGVDGAISTAGGPELKRLRLALPILSGGGNKRCRAGDAVKTGPSEEGTLGDLNVNFVIHAVGPNYNYLDTFEEGDALLKSAYESTLELAKANKLKSVAFSLLSAGVYRGKRGLWDLLKLSLETIVGFGAWEELEDVSVYCFSEEEVRVLTEVAVELFGE